MTHSLLSDRNVADVLNIGKSTVWRWVSQGKLPQPVRLSAGVSRWRSADIENFINQAAVAA